MTVAAPPLRTSRAGTVAWALPAVVLLLTCGWIGLFEPTETRYAEIAREMLRSGDWLVPRLNGIAHFHKPPVAYWGAAAGMAVAGVNEWGARLFNALAAGFTLWAVARLARRLEGETAALLAPVVVASTVLFAAVGRQLSSDLPLTAATAWFWVAYLAARDRGPGARPGYALFAALAAGFMAKGPIIFLHTILPLIGVSLVTRDARTWAPLRGWRGWGFFALLALPWYLIVVARFEGLFAYFLREQVWARYATTVHRRSGPWYYFAGVLVVGALPWTLAAVGEMLRRVREGTRAMRFETALLLSWAILPAAFFSTAGSKLPAYVLPETLAVGILAASALSRSPRREGWIAALVLAAVAIGLEWAGPAALGNLVGASRGTRLELPPAAHAAAAIWLLAAMALAIGKSRTGAFGAWAGFLAILLAAGPLEGPLGSPRPLADLIARARTADEPLVEYGEFNAGLPFYLETRALLVEVPRDLRFEALAGGDGHPAVAHTRDLLALVRRNGRVWLFAKRGQSLRLAEDLDLVSEPVAVWRDREMTVLRPME